MKVPHLPRNTKLAHTALPGICALLIILFVYTATNIIADYHNFKQELGRSPFVQPLSGLIAATLPAAELLIAFLLIMKKTRLPGLYLSYTLMIFFTGYIWLMLHYAWDLPCSCGGILASLTWNQHLVVNAVFAALAMVGVLLESGLRQAQPENY